MPIENYAWPLYKVVTDSFWPAFSELTFGAVAPFEGGEEAYQTLFGDNNEGDGIFVISDPY